MSDISWFENAKKEYEKISQRSRFDYSLYLHEMNFFYEMVKESVFEGMISCYEYGFAKGVRYQKAHMRKKNNKKANIPTLRK